MEAAGITKENGFPPLHSIKEKACGYCQGAGFRGRMGIYELMLMSTKLRELTFNAERFRCDSPGRFV